MAPWSASITLLRLPAAFSEASETPLRASICFCRADFCSLAALVILSLSAAKDLENKPLTLDSSEANLFISLCKAACT